MSLRIAARPLPLRAIHHHLALANGHHSSHHHHHHHHHRRGFFNLPGTSPPAAQTITASRTLPYPPQQLYALIADVDAYSSFVPYCSRSRVTQWSPPDDQGRAWPTRADLQVGWGGFDEVFTSNLRCVPDVSVEAISCDDGTSSSSLFESLITRWHLRPLPAARAPTEPLSPSTEVHLTIRYQFANPLYAAVSAAVSDKMAGQMVAAFEKRAAEQLGGARRVKQE